jgi:hypothetical protein
MTRPFDVISRDDAETIPCRRCAELYPRNALDRYLWCPPCRDRLERWASIGQHVIAILVTTPFVVWILAEGTRGVLPGYAWTLPLLAAYYLGMRIGRVLIRGYLRARRGPEEMTP